MASLVARRVQTPLEAFPNLIHTIWVPEASASRGLAPMCGDVGGALVILLFETEEEAVETARERGLTGTITWRSFEVFEIFNLARMAAKNGLGMGRCKDGYVEPMSVLERKEAADVR